MKVYFAEIPQPFEKYQELLEKLEDQQPIIKYKRQLDRETHLVSVYLKQFLTSGKKITYNKYGKPLAEGVHFNVSHDHHAVVGLKHPTSSVGIDIMHKHRRLNLENFEASFTPKEWKIINDNVQTFLQYWCVKEAYLKMLGTGLSISPERVEYLNGEISLDGKKDPVFVKVLEKGDYVFAVCTKDPISITVESWSM